MPTELFLLIMLAVLFLWPDDRAAQSTTKKPRRTTETGPGLSSYPPHS